MASFCRKAAAIRWTLMAVIAMAMLEDASSRLHHVGDKLGWSQKVNYTEWSIGKHFYLDDWLIFVFDKRYYNVLEVNETNYGLCKDKDFIQNITRGGRYVFQLKEERPYYFISGGGYCWGGMKLSLLVEEKPLPAVAVSPAKSCSSINTGCRAVAFALCFIGGYFDPNIKLW